MALIPLFPSDFFYKSVKVHPTQQFSSSSAGITGDVYLFAERSKSIKSITDELSEYHFDCISALQYDFTTSGISLFTERGDHKRKNIVSVVENYVENVSKLSQKVDNDKKLITYRFDVPHRFNSNTIRKSIFINNLLPYYESEYEKPMNFGFCNYHSLNFFTSSAAFPSNVPSDSALIYPVPIRDQKPSLYYPSSSFTYEFYINPRYTTDTPGDSYDPGSILHMPNAYCISLLSGSGKDEHGRPNTFRLALQLGDYAQRKPNTISNPPNSAASGSISERIFVSADNFIFKNIWSHCAIRWSSTGHNNLTGSFFIDGKNAGDFVIDDSFSLKNTFSDANDIPTGLVVGNWYNASNDNVNNEVGEFDVGNRAVKMSFLFDESANRDYGTRNLLTGSIDESSTHEFSFPLNAELQEVKIFSKFKTDQELIGSAKKGYYNFNDDDFLFYLPPYFVPSSSNRRMLKTVTQTIFSSSHTPFNTDVSFGQGGRSINLENFVLDLVNANQPRCYNLEESVSPSGGDPEDFDKTDFDFMPATDALYRLPQNRKRNLTILPSDLGSFLPNFDFLDERVSELTSGESEKYFIGNNGYQYSGRINLLNMLSIKESHEELSFLDESNEDSISNALLPDPEVSIFSSWDQDGSGNNVPTYITKNYSDVYGDQTSRIDLTILNRTKDVHSNEITFFDISNIFYGDAIKKESFYMHDPFVSGSAGKIKLTFKDNGFGELYRCDATGSHPTWSSAGKVLYEEGLVAMLDPTIPPFGKNEFNVTFSGDRNIHVLEMRVPISADEAVSSSNPTFQSLKPTNLPADDGLSCNLITNMYIHDENLNIVGKVNLSRPIVRKDNDKYVFKFKIDY